jgi:UDP-glucose 4-epimerase
LRVSNLHILITGGAGFIGSHLAEALLARGDTVTVIDDLSTGRMANIKSQIANPNFHFAIDTIRNAMVMDRLVSRCDVVVHLAAAVGVELIINDPVRTIETNILGTHAVLQAAARYRKKVLLASTSEVYGKGTRVPFAEDDDRLLGPTTKSRWSYSDSKAIDEFLGLAYHKQYGLPVIIARFFNTVGPRQSGRYGMVIPRFVQQALAGKPLSVYGDGHQSRCFCHVADTVRAVIALLDRADDQAASAQRDRPTNGGELFPAIGDVFNIGSTEEITILDLAGKILTLTGRDPAETLLIPYDQAYEPGFEDMRRRVPDIGKIGRAVGWEPTIALAETLRQVVEYEKAKRRKSESARKRAGE